MGTAGPDVLKGTSGPDVIHGLAGFDRLSGLGGDDIMCGGGGSANWIDGGAGDDWIDVADGWNTVLAGPGDDVMIVGGHDDLVTYKDAPRGVRVDLQTGTAAGWGHDRIVGSVWGIAGSRYGDTLTGSAGRDYLFGGDGADHLVGGRAGDELSGGPNDDMLIGSRGGDRLSGGRGSDALIGGPGCDGLAGGLQGDQLSGGPGDDFPVDQRGPNRLWGGPGDDEVYAGPGNRVWTGPGDDWLYLQVAASRRQSVDSGLGYDRAFMELQVSGSTDISSDLTAGTLAFNTEGVVVPLRGVEELRVSGVGSWHVVGTDGPDVVGTNMRLLAAMGGGDDWAFGSVYDDIIDGEDGADTAIPGGGSDTCISVESIPENDCETLE